MAVDVADVHAVSEQLTIQRMSIGPYGSSKDAVPERRPRFAPLISADDHLVEPPHLFEGRLPQKFADREPRVIEREDGTQAWLLDGLVLDEIAVNAVAGNDVEEQFVEPVRFDQVRRGTWDIKARIADMDLDGVYASVNFPSALGFGGVRLTMLDDPEFVLALVRAYNDWHLDEWTGYRPDRIIACQIPYLLDAKVAADEVRANAARGFKTVTFPDLTHLVGLPSLNSDYWDPFFAACEETGTVISVHACSGGMSNQIDPATPLGAHGVFFGVAQSIHPAIEWLYAGIPERFPDLKICLSEGGIGWVVALMDRLDHDARRKIPGYVQPDRKAVLKRNFTFCMLDDPTTLQHLRHVIGVERIVLESDYPHSDSSWPDTQEKWRRQFEGIPADEVARMAWGNMSELFHHPVPADIVADPDRF
ncbi:MAG TPA: amidohydrolase family protein [Acidimicrobiales bacterium]